MAPLSIIGALSTLPLALAHMQMSSPSPLRDPHANRPNEPKDYNILSPLNADGSNFACKGYHLNTPLTTVATYAAGSKQTLSLLGSATHGGGSCQISLSCDGGSNFQVIKSIVGGCPLSDSYDFTIPSDIPAAKKCLLAWTWFNRIGNREMYMNCAVVDITNKSKGKRDSQVSAATALARYPDLFVANLADINNCKVPETTDVIFDSPGKDVSFGNGDSASMKPSFGKGQCTGKGSKSAGSKDTTSSDSGGQWTAPVQNTPPQGGGQNNGAAVNCNDGFYHATGCWGNSQTGQQQGSQAGEQQQQQPQQPQQSQQTQQTQQKAEANTPVQQQLDAYLATLYGRSVARRNMVPAAENYNQQEYPAQPAVPYTHTHTEDCKHKPTSYPPGSHYHNAEDLDPYLEDGIDYSNKDEYSNDNSGAYKRTGRQKRWTSYTKRADGTQLEQTSAQSSAQTSDDPPAQMTPAEQFDAFLRRLVELSNNMASLIKYAAASSVNIPYYPPASTYDSPAAAPEASGQNAAAVRRHARRAQVYPGPSIGSISAPGDATDADEGFKAWFPNLVQGLGKRQLVDPVTSEASSDAGDSVGTFDAILSLFLKAFGDPFHILGDDVPAPESETSSLGNPPNADSPDFDIPDRDGHYTFPPQVFAPEPPTPELMPGYSLSPSGPVWIGDGPSDSPSMTSGDTVEPTPTAISDATTTDIFPGEPFPITTASEAPIEPDHGIFPSPASTAAEDPPLEAPDASTRRPRPGHSHPLIPFPLPANFTGPFPANTSAAPALLGNVSDPTTNLTELQPYQNKTLGELVSAILENPDLLGPSDSPTADAPSPIQTGDGDVNAPWRDGDVAVPGLNLTPVPSDSSDDAPPIDQPAVAHETNPLQDAADAAEAGVTVPVAPVSIDPNALQTAADALPWLMGPGPVITNESGREG